MDQQLVKSCGYEPMIKSVIQTIYDIIKAHGGELTVESKEGSGLIIQLPII